MSCPSENKLLDAMEGRVSAAERSKLDAHLEGCEICSELVDTSFNATTTLIEPTDKPRVRRARQAPATDALLGTTVGEYVVEQMIGSGGMGIVYRGSHPLIGKPVAIKILRPELAADADHMRRMLSEARAMSSIAHRSIVDVFAFGELDDGRQYMVMEFLQGEPLNQIIKTQAPLPAATLLPLLDGILEALAASHSAGVIHRDLKPSNLYVVKQTDGARFVKLLDFGLAKRELDDQGHTRAGRLVMGTPGYMAPEQIRAEAVSEVSDLYALGIIAYELATGRRPFRGSNPLEVMRQQVDMEPAPPSKFAKDLPPELEKLILKLMAKSPKNRPASADSVRQLIKALMVVPALEPVQAPSRPTWKLVAGGAALAAVLLIAIATRMRSEPTPEPRGVQTPIVQVAVEPEPVRPPPEVARIVEPAPPPQVPVVAAVKSAPQSRLSQKVLLERASKLRKRLVKATPSGEEPDQMTAMLLKNAERDAKAARGDAELKRVEQTLSDIERKYFKR